MTTCAKCKSVGVDVAHVKACFGVGVAPHQAFAQPERTTQWVGRAVPDSDYAIIPEDGVVQFYRVKRGKKGSRWDGFVFVSRLYGAPGDWRTVPVRGGLKTMVLAVLGQDPQAAAVAFSREHGVCACCGSPLSDPESIALGLGPICVKRFAA